MKNIIGAFTLSIILLGNVWAAEIGVVDNGRLLEESSVAKQAQKDVLRSRDALQQTFAKLNEELERSLRDNTLSQADKLQKRKAVQQKLESAKKDLDRLVATQRQAVQNQIEAAIKAEAQAQGLGMVVSKNVTFYGGKDITSQVLQRLK